MSKAKSIFNFSIFSLIGASIGFVISVLFLNDDSKSINEEIYEPMSQKFDRSVSVFHQLDNQSSTQSNNSLLVLENENDLHKSNFNLFRFIMTINFLLFILIGLVVYIKNIPLKDILKIFLDFN